MTKAQEWVMSVAAAVIAVGIVATGMHFAESYAAKDCVETSTVMIPVKIGSSTVMQPREVCED